MKRTSCGKTCIVCTIKIFQVFNTPCPTHAQLPPLPTSLTEGAFVTSDACALTLAHHPKSIADISADSWCCTLHGFGQMYKDTDPTL